MREPLTREEGSLKKGGEGESGVKEQTLHVAVEGVIPLWRGTNSQVRQTLQELSAQMASHFSQEWSLFGSFIVTE